MTCVSSLSCAQVNVCVPISYLQSCGVRVHVCDCVSTVSVLSVCIAAAVHEACACRVRVPVRGRCRQDTSDEVACPTSARVAAGAHVRELRVWVLFSVSRSGDAQPPCVGFFSFTHILHSAVSCHEPRVCVVCGSRLCERETRPRESRERHTRQLSHSHTALAKDGKAKDIATGHILRNCAVVYALSGHRRVFCRATRPRSRSGLGDCVKRKTTPHTQSHTSPALSRLLARRRYVSRFYLVAHLISSRPRDETRWGVPRV